MKQVNPNLSPAQAKQILQQTARDVVEGSSNLSSSGASARAGPDLATGYGLVDAYAAVKAVKTNSLSQFDSVVTFSIDKQLYQAEKFILTKDKTRRALTMTSQFPKLNAKFHAIVDEFQKILEEKFENGEIEELEIQISEVNFVSRSTKTKAVWALARTLKSLNVVILEPKKVTPQHIQEIQKKHVLAAKSLLKLQKYREIATLVLVHATEKPEDTNQKGASVAELATEALGEFSSQNNTFAVIPNGTIFSKDVNTSNSSLFSASAYIPEIDEFSPVQVSDAIIQRDRRGNITGYLVTYGEDDYLCSSFYMDANKNTIYSSCIRF